MKSSSTDKNRKLTKKLAFVGIIFLLLIVIVRNVNKAKQQPDGNMSAFKDPLAEDVELPKYKSRLQEEEENLENEKTDNRWPA